jgi:hypothetical protein
LSERSFFLIRRFTGDAGEASQARLSSKEGRLDFRPKLPCMANTIPN